MIHTNLPGNCVVFLLLWELTWSAIYRSDWVIWVYFKGGFGGWLGSQRILLSLVMMQSPKGWRCDIESILTQDFFLECCHHLLVWSHVPKLYYFKITDGVQAWVQAQAILVSKRTSGNIQCPFYMDITGKILVEFRWRGQGLAIVQSRQS